MDGLKRGFRLALPSPEVARRDGDLNVGTSDLKRHEVSFPI